MPIYKGDQKLTNVTLAGVASGTTGGGGIPEAVLNDIIERIILLENRPLSFTVKIVGELPPLGETGIIYLLLKTDLDGNYYEEYLWVAGTWEEIGTTKVDLNDYATRNEISTMINNSKGTKGYFTLYSNSWVSKKQSVVLTGLEDKDALFLTPFTRNDKIALESANMFITSDRATVTFEANTVPTTNIELDYFIVRGK